MNRILIIGAGGFGREVLAWMLDIPESERGWTIAGFLDDDPAALAGYATPFPVVGKLGEWRIQPDDRFVVAIGDPRLKLEICRAVKARDGQFETIVHPTAIVGPRCVLGEGCVLCPGVVLTSDVTLGDFVSFNVHATAGHDARVGDGCTLSAHCDVTGHTTLGEGVLLGTHACVIPGGVVGDYAVVGAGSTVLKTVPPHAVVGGVPARPLGR